MNASDPRLALDFFSTYLRIYLKCYLKKHGARRLVVSRDILGLKRETDEAMSRSRNAGQVKMLGK